MLQIDEEEVLARRYFLGGCFGLPWLWVVNCAYFYPKLKEGTVSAGARSWVMLSFSGSVIAFAIIVSWLITFQLNWRSWGSGIYSYMISIPEKDLTGW